MKVQVKAWHEVDVSIKDLIDEVEDKFRESVGIPPRSHRARRTFLKDGKWVTRRPIYHKSMQKDACSLMRGRKATTKEIAMMEAVDNLREAYKNLY